MRSVSVSSKFQSRRGFGASPIIVHARREDNAPARPRHGTTVAAPHPSQARRPSRPRARASSSSRHRRRPRPSTRRRHGGLREPSVQQTVDLEVHEVREHEDCGQPRAAARRRSPRRAGAPAQPPPHAAADAPAAPRAARPSSSPRVAAAPPRAARPRGARARARRLARAASAESSAALSCRVASFEPRGHAPQLPVALRQRLPRGPRGLRQVRGLRGPLLALVGQRLLRERARGLGRRRAPGRSSARAAATRQSLTFVALAVGECPARRVKRSASTAARSRASLSPVWKSTSVSGAPDNSSTRRKNLAASLSRSSPTRAASCSAAARGPRRPWPRPCARGAAP